MNLALRQRQPSHMSRAKVGVLTGSVAGGAFGGVEFVSGSCPVELFDVDVAQGHGSAELMGREADLGEVLYGFGLHEGVGERGAVSEKAMVGQENSVVRGDERFEAGAYFFGSGSGVRCEGNEACGHEDLGTDGLVERFAAGCEGGGDGRVGMDDGFDIGSQTVDSEMHADFAGHVSCACQFVTVVVDDDHVG
jgi:hypothetical protein